MSESPVTQRIRQLNEELTAAKQRVAELEAALRESNAANLRWVARYKWAETPCEMPPKPVAELERSRDAWEKYYNDMANTKDADIQRLEIQREQIEKRELALRTQLVALYCLRQPDPGISEWYTIRITKDHAERIMEALAK